MRLTELARAPDVTREPSAADPYDRRSRVAFADVFRTIAILAVVSDHILRRVTNSTPIQKAADIFGVLGVDFFFVLTGFLLARPYVEAIIGTREFPSSKLFYARRFLRIWPLYAVAVLVSALGERIHGGHPVHVGDILAHLTMTHNFFPAYYLGKFNIPLWTMAVDADFYLLLPPLAFVGAIVARNVHPDRRMALIFAACAIYFIGSLAYRLAIVYAYPNLVSDENGSFTFLRNVIGFGGSFSLGIAIGAFETSRVKCLPAFAYGTLGVAVVAALALLSCAVLTTGSSSDGAFDAPLLQATFDHIGALSAGGLLFAGLHGALPIISKLARTKSVVFLATLSFAIYLFHAPILNTIYNSLGGHRLASHPSWRYGIELTAATIVATLLVAYVAHTFIEEPFLRRKDALRERPA